MWQPHVSCSRAMIPYSSVMAAHQEQLLLDPKRPHARKLRLRATAVPARDRSACTYAACPVIAGGVHRRRPLSIASCKFIPKAGEGHGAVHQDVQADAFVAVMPVVLHKPPAEKQHRRIQGPGQQLGRTAAGVAHPAHGAGAEAPSRGPCQRGDSGMVRRAVRVLHCFKVRDQLVPEGAADVRVHPLRQQLSHLLHPLAGDGLETQVRRGNGGHGGPQPQPLQHGVPLLSGNGTAFGPYKPILVAVGKVRERLPQVIRGRLVVEAGDGDSAVFVVQLRQQAAELEREVGRVAGHRAAVDVPLRPEHLQLGAHHAAQGHTEGRMVLAPQQGVRE